MAEEKYSGELEGLRVVVRGEDAVKLWNYGFYGEFREGVLVVSAPEALFLVKQGKLRVFLGEVELDFKALLNHFLKLDSDIWVKYLIFSDLRRRGYIVKPGFGSGISFRVYRRGAVMGKEPAKYLVYGAVEGKPIELSSLSRMIREARSARKDLILAIVDRQGEVTYYDVTLVTL
ncbi:MAG: tRNA-intron lyase [Candidatus Methanomethylicota archaeon]|nr:tRNA-intron lyase [Candidatus Culexmicrobium cathedralense]RLE48653.1 MAG: tRNA-intron lyase [Candidatus Verstraetearchaeota archaeon]